MFEYSVSPLGQIDPLALQSFHDVAQTSAMHDFPPFIHDGFKLLLNQAGFTDVQTEDVTENVIPMLRRFYQWAYLPYHIYRLSGRDKSEYANALAGYEIYKHRQYWRYNIVTALRKEA